MRPDLQPIEEYLTDTMGVADFRARLKDMLRDYTYDRLVSGTSGKTEADIMWSVEGFIDALDRCIALKAG